MLKGKFISKEESTILQAFAVLMMVFHHLFTFPERISVEYFSLLDFSSIHFELIFAAFCKICVAVFAFSSGYGLYKITFQKYSSNQYRLKENYKSSIGRIFNFYSIYWLVFIVCIPIGFFIGVYKFNLLTFIKNFFAVTASYNGEWWYAGYYICFLVLFPLIFSFIYKFKNKAMPIIYLLFMLIVTFLIAYNISIGKVISTRFITYLICFIGGCLFVEYNIFERFNGKVSKTKGRKLCWWILFLITMIIRLKYITNADYDYLFVPILIYGFLRIIKLSFFKGFIQKIFIFIGKYSVYIWLTHTFFAYYYFQTITYAPKLSILIFIWDVILSIALGIVLNKIHSLIFCSVKKLSSKKQ